MAELPILELRDQLLATLARDRRLLLTAPTGSGKSTQVPQLLLDGGALATDNRRGSPSTPGQVVILQPRRLAARLLASWVARSRGTPLGQEIGYQIRLDNVTSPATRIRYVTEGILLRQMLGDPALRGISTLIFDEFHERHLYGDITLARALDLQESVRPDLRIIVMSATLELGPLETYLRPCATLRSEGRTYPVEIEYLPKPANDAPVWETAVDALTQLVQQHPAGDALVFMPGGYEISRTVEAARAALGRDFVVLPLHGELAPRDQDAAVARYPQRKIVVATNVAETSITIDGVRIVVDGGLARVARYDPYRGINTLLIEKISRAAADQRAGRAGRTAPGHCLRLWTEREHGQRPPQELPEIRRLDLAEVALTLKASGVDDLTAFRWLEPPDPKALARAEQLLLDLGALEKEEGGRMKDESPRQDQSPSSFIPHPSSFILSAIGRRMLAFPVHPRYARMLLAAGEHHCVRQVALIAALTQGRDLLIRNPGRDVLEARAELFGEQDASDLFVLMRAWRYAERNNFQVDRCRRVGIHAQNARQVGPLFDQFLAIARAEGLPLTPERSTPNAQHSTLNAGTPTCQPLPDTRNLKPATQTAGEPDTPSSTPNPQPSTLNHQPSPPDSAIRRCLLTGFADHVARRLDAGTLRCALVHGRRGVLARESVVKTPLLVATEVAEIEGRDLNVILNLATAIEESWLQELFPADYNSTSEAFYDSSLRRVRRRWARRFHDLVLEEKLTDDVPADDAARILAAEVAAGNCVLPQWDEAVEQWILRLNRLAEWMPDLGLPALRAEDRPALLEQICHGAVTYKEIKDRAVWPVVKGWLSGQQQKLVDQFAPERLELPGGRKAKVIYRAEGPPRLAARIQDLYGVHGLWVADRRVPVLLEILAPNQRPVQVTQNLATFWKDTYPSLKQQLQRKYPKHEWR